MPDPATVLSLCLALAPVSETLVVTGTRVPTPKASIPGSVTVVDTAAIRALEPASVMELLQSVGGLNVTQYGGRGGVSTVLLRGAEPNFTVVLIDGVRVNDPTNSRGGSFDFATINVAEIERIEIVHGALSSVYGSDALAGAVNIITTGGTDRLRTSVSAELGQHSSGRAAATLSVPVGRASQLAVNASHAAEGATVAGNDFANTTLGARLNSQYRSGNLALAARFAHTASEAFPEDSGGPRLAELRAVDTRAKTLATLALASQFELTPRIRWLHSASFARLEDEFSSPGIAPGVRAGVPPNRSDSTLERWQFGSHLDTRLRPALHWLVGADFTRDAGVASGSVTFAPGFDLPTDFRLRRDVVGVFTEFTLHPRTGFGANASVRFDDATGARSQVTARLGAQYQHGASRVFINWGEGYKLPSFFALGHALVGNPQLQPETSTNWEAGIAQTMLDGALELTLAGFHNGYRNLIDFDFERFTNVNRDRVRARGIELVVGVRPTARLQLQAQAHYTDVDVLASAVTLRQRPAWRVGVNLAWQAHPRVRLNVNWRYRDQTFDSAVPTGGVQLPAVQRLNALLGVQATQRLELWIALRDVFDRDNEAAVGFPSGGRLARLGVRWTPHR